MSYKDEPKYQKFYQSIEENVPFISLKPFSHNIIGLSLSGIAKEYGNDAANELIDVFNLERQGWSKVE